MIRLENVLKTSSRCLEDFLKTPWKHLRKMSWIRLEDVLKRYGQDEYFSQEQEQFNLIIRLENVLKTCWICLEGVLKTSWRRFCKASWRCLEEVLKTFFLQNTSWRLLSFFIVNCMLTRLSRVWSLFSQPVLPSLSSIPPLHWNENLSGSNTKRNPSEVFLGKDVLKICSKFSGDHPRQSAITMKLQSSIIEIPLRHRCYPAYFQNLFLRTFLEYCFCNIFVNFPKL